MSVARLEPRFVEEMPEPLEPGVFYVSLEHRSMLHLCACGCGEEVSLPLTPLDWHFTYDGEDISVWPSVGSWSLPCRSHYVVDRGRVRWASDWSEEGVAAGRRRDRRRREEREAPEVEATEPVMVPTEQMLTAGENSTPKHKAPGALAAARRWLSALWPRD